jgi:CheY-like chemotaxis protein
LKILIAEDEPGIALTYKISFEDRNHDVIVAGDGEECVKQYKAALDDFKNSEQSRWRKTPFDVVILDYKMPRKDGMQVAREILAASPKQRIIFASAYVLDTLEQAVKDLDRVVEMVQKPFDIDDLVSLVEDEEIWKGLQDLNANIKELKKMGLSHDVLVDLLQGLKKIQKDKALRA